MTLSLRRLVTNNIRYLHSNYSKTINTPALTDNNLISKFNGLAIRGVDKDTNEPLKTMTFTNSSIKITDPISNRKPIMDMPFIPIRQIIPFIPIIPKAPILDTPTNNNLDCPSDIVKDEKQAIRMIVIRRRKMNKHKLKKLRKRQRYDCLKRFQRKELRKEKHFQVVLMHQVRKYENFSAAKYVNGKLGAAFTKPLSRTWKGKRLPKFIIRQLLGIDPKIDYKGIKPTQDDGF